VKKKPKSIKPEQVLEIALRRRWFLIVPFFLITLGGIYLSIVMPKTYEASALILVEHQSVPPEYVRSTISMDIESRISNISQQIMSRTNLEKIIRHFPLYTGEKYEKMPMEAKIESLKKLIQIKVIPERRGAGAFTISFREKDPPTVMDVTNMLAEFYIEENTKARESQAIGTSSFLNEELNAMQKRLEEFDEKIRIYRLNNSGSLPEQFETNLRNLERLQAQKAARQEYLKSARIQLIVLEREIAEGLSTTVLLQGGPNPAARGQQQPPLTLDQMRFLYDDLITKYTEKHPDVINLKRAIAELEQKAGENKNGSEGHFQPGAGLQAIQHDKLKREIMAAEEDLIGIEKEIALFQRRIDETPKREHELLSLRRGYDNLKSTHDSLLHKKLQAEIALNMEIRQGGDQFRIIDRAVLPERPVEPDMRKILLMTLFAALATGGGLVFMLEYFDNSFKNIDAIESFLGLPVLATIPEIRGRKEIVLQKAMSGISIVSILLSMIAFAVFGLVALRGVEQTLEIFEKIGLRMP
jgi:polysaccharide chain length determinant protein (PEP-CTERM system associated)